MSKKNHVKEFQSNTIMPELFPFIESYPDFDTAGIEDHIQAVVSDMLSSAGIQNENQLRDAVGLGSTAAKNAFTRAAHLTPESLHKICDSTGHDYNSVIEVIRYNDGALERARAYRRVSDRTYHALLLFLLLDDSAQQVIVENLTSMAKRYDDSHDKDQSWANSIVRDEAMGFLRAIKGRPDDEFWYDGKEPCV